MASGRIAVIGAGSATVAVLAFTAGLGLVTQPTSAPEKVIGGAAIMLSMPAAVGGLLLLLRRGPARAAGTMGAAAIGTLGILLFIASLASVESCSTGSADERCPVIVGGIAALGVGISAFGVVSMLLIRRAHPAAVTRQRRDRA